ncbi:MAG: DNA repair protein RecO [Candidatus Staskawiczbacteria bacterium]|nr:DNA repair protein RecO [Candidatus Staskawiczbacteria bacterium]
MALTYATEAFVFKKEDRLEADSTFSVFTHDFGRLEVVGKAIRKITSKLKGNIEIFSLSRIEFVQGKNKKILTEALFVKKFKNISQVPEKLVIAHRITEILDVFLKGEQRDEKIWDMLVHMFEKLDSDSLQSKHYQLLYCYFVGNFTSILGYGLQLSKCAVCGQTLDPRLLYFSNKEGGTICGVCAGTHEGSIKITSDTVKILRLILNKDWQTISRLKAAEKIPLEALENYVRYLSNNNSFKKE